MTELPKAFVSRMTDLLQGELPLFLKSYEQTKTRGLRVNKLKLSVDDFLQLSPFHLQPIPWVDSGFYYDDSDTPGKHPYHAAGLYYIQEPSAMAVAPGLSPEPGERVLDLCAAPGGKTTHLASFMQGEGILVSNEITASRAKILAENVERFGLTQTVVLNETPDRLASVFPEWFDRILVDAPCSGEGMFRKDPQVCAEWSAENVAFCAIRQIDILKAAGKMLRPGGKLVYSTCTFAPEENEALLHQFLNLYPDFSLLPFPNAELFSAGRPEWGGGRAELQFAVRLWPHRLQGEGHFAALLEKKADSSFSPKHSRSSRIQSKVPPEALSLFQEFGYETLPNWQLEGTFILQGEHLYIQPQGLPDLKSLKWVRPGLHLGDVANSIKQPAK